MAALKRQQKLFELMGTLQRLLNNCMNNRSIRDTSYVHAMCNATIFVCILLQALCEEVKAHKVPLTELVLSGRALEEYVQDKGATGADTGYARVEDRYNTLEVYT